MVNFVGCSFHSPLVKYILSPLNGESIDSNPSGETKFKAGGFAVSALGILDPKILIQRPVLCSLQMVFIFTQPFTAAETSPPESLILLHIFFIFTQPFVAYGTSPPWSLILLQIVICLHH